MADMIMRDPRKNDEHMALAAHRASLAEGVDTVFLRADEDINFDDLLEECRTGIQSQEGDKVPSDFLFAEGNGEVVGRTSIRHGSMTSYSPTVETLATTYFLPTAAMATPDKSSICHYGDWRNLG